ncbi:MAG: zf-HC2 domain-containing protein [Thermoleophilia bacterium]|nr:zf-HC2 domain-containing protein [Thermoleophilia bacterium]
MTRLRGRDERRCDRALQSVSLDLDGELSHLERALLRAHLGRCPACAASAAEMRALAAALRSAPLEKPMRAPAAPRGRRARARAFRVALAATLAVLAAGLGVVAGSVRDRPAEPPTPTGSEIALLPSSDDARDVQRVRPRERPEPVEPRLGGV